MSGENPGLGNRNLWLRSQLSFSSQRVTFPQFPHVQQSSALPSPRHRAAETSDETSVSKIFKPTEFDVDVTYNNHCLPPCAWLPVKPDSYSLFLAHTGALLLGTHEPGKLLLVWNLNRPVVSCLGVVEQRKRPSVRARARNPCSRPNC